MIHGGLLLSAVICPFVNFFHLNLQKKNCFISFCFGAEIKNLIAIRLTKNRLFLYFFFRFVLYARMQIPLLLLLLLPFITTQK